MHKNTDYSPFIHFYILTFIVNPLIKKKGFVGITILLFKDRFWSKKGMPYYLQIFVVCFIK